MRNIWFVFVIIVLHLARITVSCPDGCRCTMQHTRDKESKELGHRVLCGRKNMTNLDSIDFSRLPNDTISLIITETLISKLSTGSFAFLQDLIKLEFSKNQLVSIEDGAFENMTSLEKLDLSNNSLNTLTPEMLQGLPSLQKFDIRGNPLICDCHLNWILDWAQLSKVRISPKSTCSLPPQRRGASLAKMSKKDMHCNWPLQLPVFEIRPNISQLLFEGDSITFECRVSDIEKDATIVWFLDGQNQLSETDISTIKETKSNGVIISSLTIYRLSLNHTGSWMCHVSTSRGNSSRSVNTIVVAENAPSCPKAVTWGNKGQYLWPSTVGGITMVVPCAGAPPIGLEYQPSRAYHTCGTDGVWQKLDTSACPYVSEVTKVLEHFAKSNLTQATTVVDTARGLRNYTGNGSMLTDYLDIVFIAQTLENYLEFVPHHKELGEIIIDVISVIMKVDRKLLFSAQEWDRTCSKLVLLVDKLPEMLLESSINRYHDNIIVEEFLVKSESFPGMRCTSYEGTITSNWGKNLHCISVNATIPLNIQNPIEASIFVPFSVFGPVQSSTSSIFSVPLSSSIRSLSHKLQFVLYRSSSMFPRPNHLGNERDITSVVIGCKKVPTRKKTLEQLVEITLALPVYTTDASPVRWDPLASDGKGDWVSEGCTISAITGRLVSFTCNQLGLYGVLQDLEIMKAELHYQQAQFRLSHPTVYAGTLVCCLLLMTSVFVFFKEWKNIKMPKKMKHSLVNTWIALILLDVVFALGIAQTDFRFICQSVGLVIHYLTLSALIWMVISANNLYKHLRRNDDSELTPDEPPPDPNVPPKSIMRFYFLGWGVGTIVCGISAAVHLDAYSNQQFCFLSSTSSLAAFYGPVSVILLFLLIYFFLVFCLLKEEKETSGILLVGSPTNTDSESIFDAEFSALTQLRSHLIVLLLFSACFSTAVFCVLRPLSKKISFDIMIFGLAYCLFSLLLGIFVFSFFCYSKQDICKHLRCWQKGKALVENDNINVVYEANPEVLAKDDNLATDYTEERESVSTVNNQVEKLANVLGYFPKEREGIEKSRSVNLLSSHRPTVNMPTTTSSVEIFYDPRQSIVAKRFFEKNRRQQQLKAMHKNNLEKAQASDSAGTIARARAYSDTERASSAHGSGSKEERSQLCTSQSYSGVVNSETMRLNQKDLESKTTSLTVQNGLIEVHVEPLVTKPTSTAIRLVIQPQGNFDSRNHTEIPNRVNTVSPNFRSPLYASACGRSSCSECTVCSHQRQPSICSQSCCSDLTSISHGNKKRRSRSGSGRNRLRKNSRQYSWDDKYDANRTKIFVQPATGSPGVMESNECQTNAKSGNSGRKKHRCRTDNRNSERVSNQECRNQFSRSQSAYEHLVKSKDQAMNDALIGQAKGEKETCM